jgi:hypothetical protein
VTKPNACDQVILPSPSRSFVKHSSFWPIAKYTFAIRWISTTLITRQPQVNPSVPARVVPLKVFVTPQLRMNIIGRLKHDPPHAN